MIIVMKTGSNQDLVKPVIDRIESLGLHAHLSAGEERTIIGVVGLPLPDSLDDMFGAFTGVEQVIRVTKKFKLVGWDFHPQKTVIKLGDVAIGG
ncbi:MAG: 3-deoxy-7-phosphoheptulonate synthase, partial [Thermomicrobiales bacterium]